MFLESAGIQSSLKQHGSIANRDLAVEVCAQDWPTKYKDIWERYRQERREAELLAGQMGEKHDMYIAREIEYRECIDRLESEIETVSKHPLRQLKEPTQDAMRLGEIQLKLGKEDKKKEAAKKRTTEMLENMVPSKQDVDRIHEDLGNITQYVDKMQHETKAKLTKSKNTLWKRLSIELDRHKEDLKFENSEGLDQN